MKISVIIPVWNEASTIKNILQFLTENAPGQEIIVVDGQSTDNTIDLVEEFPNVRLLRSPSKGRAIQMNYAASLAQGDILYFLHADTRPPKDFVQLILAAVNGGAKAGCFRFRFDSKKFMLRINSWFTRLPFLWCRGGDQSLFILAATFREFKGFDEHFLFMEEYDLIVRLGKRMNFHIIPKEVLVSARKYSTNSWLKVMWANKVAYSQFVKGVDTSIIKKEYQENLNPYL